MSAFLLLAALFGVGQALAGSDAGVDVLVVDGLMEDRLIDFIKGSIESTDAQVVVLQLDSPATLTGDLPGLLDLMADPPAPVAVWAGPEPGRVSGGAVRVLAAADLVGAAPGVMLGPASPSFAGGDDDADEIAAAHPELPPDVIGSSLEVTAEIAGFVDIVTPSIGQFVVALDGLVVDGVELETAREEVDDEGLVRVVPSVPVTFVEPGLVDRTIRLGASPEAAFFFVVAGLSLAIFEFYAAGPGLAAATGAVTLLLGGYGIAVLPVRWWAVALIPIGLVLYTIDFQRNDLGWRSLLGTAALLGGGLYLTDAAPQVEQTWWVVALVVVSAALWFAFALSTVVRARFSTQTIGRDHLVGRTGEAVTAIEPDGTVLVDGALWKARATRASGIGAGDSVEVLVVDGIVLEVGPLANS